MDDRPDVVITVDYEHREFHAPQQRMRRFGGLEQLLPFLGVGSLVGAVFAAIVFAASAFSLPMILDRKVDAITASVTSINAVLRNKKPMLLWAALIGLSVARGFATACLVFAVLLPLIGHATWHGYRETIDSAARPLDSVE